MINFRKPLEQYRDLTLNMIERVKNDEELSDLINMRDNILKEFDEADYSKEEFKKIVMEFNILKLDSELQLLVKKEMVKIKKKIENIRSTRVASKGYGKSREQIKLFMRRA